MAFVIFYIMAKLKRESVLWSVIDPNQGNTSYLMGTMHLKDYNAYTYATMAEKYLNLTSGYAGEMHLDQAASTDMHQYFKLEGELLLSDLFSHRQYRRMNKIFFHLTGASLDHLIDLKPMAISNILAESYTNENYALPLDQHLWNYAKRLDKELYGLESVQDQIDILQKIPLKHQIISLKQSLRNVSKQGKMIKSLGNLYAQGRLHQLYRKSKKSLGGLKELMLYDRNTKMVSKFCELNQKGTLFAAVGAAHLSGLKGMLHLLRKEGFHIRPIYE